MAHSGPSNSKTTAIPHVRVEYADEAATATTSDDDAIGDSRRRVLETLRLASNCLMGFSNGITDSAPGALLPYMQSDYHIEYGTVSLIFVANAMGYLLSAPYSHALDRKGGRAGAYVVSEFIMGMGFLVLVLHYSFPATVFAYCLVGLGEAFNLALNNVYCASLGSSSASALGLLHGSYGAGGTVGPLIATSMVVRGIKWSVFYFVGVGCTIINGLGALQVFKGYDREKKQVPVEREQEPLLPTESRQEGADTNSEGASVWAAITHRTTLSGAIFIFAYQGAEVSMSGWMIEFLLSYRGGDPAVVGYVTVGFWAGISLGRFFISGPANRLGPKTAVSAFTALCIGLQITIWAVPSIAANAIAAACIGLFLGPVYPCAIVVFGNTLPKEMHLTSLSTISAMGSSGGAVVPLLAGLLAQKFGTVILHPLCVAMYSLMLLSWLSLPSVRLDS